MGHVWEQAESRYCICNLWMDSSIASSVFFFFFLRGCASQFHPEITFRLWKRQSFFFLTEYRSYNILKLFSNVIMILMRHIRYNGIIN